MIRMPPYLDNCTSRFARTTRCDGHAIYYHPAPITRRFFYGLCSYGWPWFLTWAIAAAVFLTGCDDLESYAADQASLADAIAQAAKEAGK